MTVKVSVDGNDYVALKERDLFLGLYEQARFALRYWGVDDKRFHEAMRGLDEVTDEIKTKIEHGDIDA